LEKDINLGVYTILDLVHMCRILYLHVLNFYVIG